jgi:hypothetical protein
MLTPDALSNTRDSPLSASTATSFKLRAGQSCEGRRDSITARRWASDTVAASSANLPTARRISRIVRAGPIADAICPAKLSRSSSTMISALCSSG